jgi:hypothetical protein
MHPGGLLTWIGRAYTRTAEYWASQDTFPRALADLDGDGCAEVWAFGRKELYGSPLALDGQGAMH